MPARNSDGTIRNARAAKQYTMRSLIARWIEAEIVRRKQMGFSFRVIAEQVAEIARGGALPMIPFSVGLEFPPNYSVTDRACAKAFSKAFARAPVLEVEEMRRLDTERCEDIYRGLAPGIVRGDPSSGSVAIKALGHKARINGYAAVPEIGQGPSGLKITIHMEEPTDEPKPVNDLPRRTRAINSKQ